MARETCFFFFQAEDGIRDLTVTGVQTCALPLASAELGEALDVEFPGPPSPPATLPTVRTFFDRAANASLVDLIGIGRALLVRLEREGCRVNGAIEREVTATRGANSAGAAGEDRGTGFGVSADVWRIAGDDVLVVSDA